MSVETDQREFVPDNGFANAVRGDHYAWHPAERRVRAEFRGKIIADSEHVYMLINARDIRRRAADIEDNQYWMGGTDYYWPIEDVDLQYLVPNGKFRQDQRIGTGAYYDLRVGNAVVENAAWIWDGATEDAPLRRYIGIIADALDAIYEEEDQVVAPRNPYHSVEVRNTRKHVVVKVGGLTVADTTQARVLYETGLPPRFYIPRQDVKMELLTQTTLRTTCPYKGECIYWTVNAEPPVENIAWSYPRTYPHATRIEHLIAFYEERGAVVIVDGVERPAPGTLFPKKAFRSRLPVLES